MSRPRWPDSHYSLSGKPGTVHVLGGLESEVRRGEADLNEPLGDRISLGFDGHHHGKHSREEQTEHAAGSLHSLNLRAAAMYETHHQGGCETNPNLHPETPGAGRDAG
jgi:hypothetical protein